jgi:hypothetical protein
VVRVSTAKIKISHRAVHEKAFRPIIYQKMNERTNIEKKAAKIFFWGLVVPVVFLVFIRIFFLLFNYIYGTVLIFIVGEKYTGMVMFDSSVLYNRGFVLGAQTVQKACPGNLIRGGYRNAIQ